MRRLFEALDEGVERKIVYPDDILTYHVQWDELVRQTLPAIFGTTDQPLLKFVPQKTWEAFEKLKTDPSQMVSLLNCHYYPMKTV
ncbi:hypothetical protein [Flavobacterium sp.]|uniref:hypothetical protein n=1 Tax=Flavobacterium sp. TaxID=239 RepID=UPI0039E49C3F